MITKASAPTCPSRGPLRAQRDAPPHGLPPEQIETSQWRESGRGRTAARRISPVLSSMTTAGDHHEYRPSIFRYADFIEGAPGRRGKKAVKSPRSRRKGHTR